MGTDIHWSIQQQQADGTWQDQPWQDTSWREEEKAPSEPGAPPKAPAIFDSGNYDLFAILANVRNGIGFAGCATGSGWPSIAAGRGLPADMPAEILADPDFPEDGPRWLGDHSFTWVDREELRAFPWDTTEALQFGVVSAEVYEQFRQDYTPPESYCGWIGGPGIKVYSPDEYQQAQAAGLLVPRPYVRISWPETARQATLDWVGKVLPWLDATFGTEKPLRLVMGFDS